ncbi:MAG: hypothetical protein IK063_05690 [Clostridia bacterium]|nr:hypothetical protein [Clostridia bacterium]
MNLFLKIFAFLPLDVAAPFGGFGGMGVISVFLLILLAVVIVVTAAVIIRLIKKKKSSEGPDITGDKNE